MNRILLVANKVWEVHPLLDALLNPRFQPDPQEPYLPEELNSPWRFRYGDPPRPRAVYQFEDTSIEIWCIADHMNPDVSGSSSEEKARILPSLFHYRPEAPAMVIAFGTASPSPDLWCNGSVLVGSNVFIHDGHPAGDPNPRSAWHPEHLFGRLLTSSAPAGLLESLNESRAGAEREMLFVSVWPSAPRLSSDADYVAVSTVNVTDYHEYAAKDAETMEAIKTAGITEPIGSVETTHGVIRAQSDAPFLFVSGIPNRFGKFDEDMGPRPEAQNYAAGFNAGIVVAHLLPMLNEWCGSGPA